MLHAGACFIGSTAKCAVCCGVMMKCRIAHDNKKKRLRRGIGEGCCGATTAQLSATSNLSA